MQTDIYLFLNKQLPFSNNLPFNILLRLRIDSLTTLINQLFSIRKLNTISLIADVQMYDWKGNRILKDNKKLKEIAGPNTFLCILYRYFPGMPIPSSKFKYFRFWRA